MVILHISHIEGNPYLGVDVVVPQHLKAQSQYADVAFVNIANAKIDVNCQQFEYSEDFSLSKLPAPYNRPDIVIFHECYRIQYIKISKELKKLKIPYVILPHGELAKDAQKKKRLKKIAANILIFNSFINAAVGIQCLSEIELSNTNFGKYKFVATNGIDMPSVQKTQFSETGLRFTYIGRLDAYHKGLDLMMDGVCKSASLMRKNDCTLDVYGPDIFGRRAHLETLIAERNIGDIVKLHDPVSKGEKEQILLASDVFLQTSRFEGMPMGILEALSYGVPCIVTEGTNLAKFVKDNDAGWGCATDSEEISNAINTAISQKDMFLEKSQNARKAVCNSFSWNHIAKTAVDEYTQLMK